MYFLRCGIDDHEESNSEQISYLTNDYDMEEYILSQIENNELHVDDVINLIYTEDHIGAGDLYLIKCILTIGDDLPKQYYMDHFKAMGHYFSLQVNLYCSEHRLDDRRIPAAYIGLRASSAYQFDHMNWIAAEASLQEQLAPENIIVPIQFKCTYTEMVLSIPVVQIKKGFLRKKAVGYMLAPGYKVCGSFTIGNNTTKYRLPKSYIFDLLVKKINNNKSYVFQSKDDFSMNIPLYDDNNTISDLLQINSFYSIGSFDINSDNIYMENDLVYVDSKTFPVFNEGEENVPMVWERLRDHLFRILTHNGHFYIPYIYKDTVYILAE